MRSRQFNRHSIGYSELLLSMMVALLLSPSLARAARWTLVDFGASLAETQCPYPGWQQVLYDEARTQFVQPDQDPEHSGITETDALPEGQTAFFGVRGTVPLELRRGQRWVATFYNRSAEYGYLAARISFTDDNAPNREEATRPWFTMHHRQYRPEGEWMPPDSLVEVEYYVSDTNMVSAPGALPSEGVCTVVNLNKPYNDNRFVLTRIELTDEVDLAPPAIPGNVKAQWTTLTAGAPNSAVELSWDLAQDPGENATGVSRYLIYRNGKLYDMVPAEGWEPGTRARYVDINLKPGAAYVYEVTALDAAPFGMYPTPQHPLARVGNESAKAGPVSVSAPTWSYEKLINPWIDLVYLGAFRLPYTEDEPWAFAAMGLTFYPEGNPDRDPARELRGSLYGFTHLGERVSEISIPMPLLSTNSLELPVARTLKTPVNLWPAAYNGATTPLGGTESKVVGITYHPAANGVEGGLYYGVCNMYATDPAAASHGWFDLGLTRAVGPWRLGGNPPDNLYPGLNSRVLFTAPASWAVQYTGGRSLITGSGFLSGGHAHSTGPTLWAIAPWEQGSLPAAGQALPAVLLLRYGSITDQEHRSLNWNIDEFAEGGAWITVGGKAAVAISYRRSVGDGWYGDADGTFDAFYDIPMPAMGDKGGAATDWKTGLMLYDPADLAAVAQGKKASWEPLPYAIFDLDRFSLQPQGGNGMAGAIAFDAAGGHLFFIEHNGDPNHEWGYSLIHVWKTVPAPQPPKLTVRLDGNQCLIQWPTANDGSRHQLQFTSALGATAAWTDLGPESIADGRLKTWAHPLSPNRASFYRLWIR